MGSRCCRNCSVEFLTSVWSKPVSFVEVQKIKSISLDNLSLRFEPTRRTFHEPETFENVIVVWWTNNLNEDKPFIEEMQSKLRPFRYYINIDEFFASILDMKHRDLILFLSYENTRQHLSKLHSMSQFISIYTISNDRFLCERWKQVYPKFQGFHPTFDSIWSGLGKKLLIGEETFVPLGINEESSKFKFQQEIQRMILVDLDYDIVSRHKIFDDIGLSYSQETALEILEQHPSFYSSITESFVDMKIDALIKLGFLIQDIHKKIQLFNSNETIFKATRRLYFGQGMTEDKIQLFRNDQSILVSMKNFLRVTSNRSSALTRARLARNHPKYVGVVFEIQLNASIPLAMVNSTDENNEEFFLSFDRVYRSHGIQQIEKYLWQIQLVVDEEHSLNHLDSNGVKVWRKISSESIFLALLQTKIVRQHEELAFIHQQLALIYDKKNEKKSSFNHRNQARIESLAFLSKYDPNLFQIYLRLNESFSEKKIYLRLNESFSEKKIFNLSLKYFQLALTIGLNQAVCDHEQVASIYSSIGQLFEERRLFDEAIKNYLSSLEFRFKAQPLNFLSITNLYGKIGDLYLTKRNPSAALPFFNEKLSLEQKHLSPNHPNLSDSNYEIAMILDRFHQEKEAVEHVSRALNIASHCFGSDHEKIEIYRTYMSELRKKTSFSRVPNGAVYE